MRWDLQAGRVELTQVTQGFEFPLLGTLDGHDWARESVLHLVLKQSSQGLNFSVLVGGNTVARGDWLSGLAPKSPLDRFVLMPDMPLDLRAAAVFPLTHRWQMPSRGWFRPVPVTAFSGWGILRT